MLKIKEQLHYRRGYTHASCDGCDYYVSNHPLSGMNGVDLGEGRRCRVIGLKPGRMYAIHPKNICDRFDNRETLEHIKNWWR
jgi:hypothetical protein